MGVRIYTEEMIDFLKVQYRKTDIDETVKLFNAKFGMNKTRIQIKGLISRNKILSGRTGHFESGFEPYNKGKKMARNENSAKTQFKKGQKPHNHKPVGSMRICKKDGYVSIKTKEPRQWRLLHVLLWENHNGPMPPGHQIRFRDNDRSNIRIDNLMLISKKQSAVINKLGLSGVGAEFKDTAVLMAEIATSSRKIKTGKANV